MQDERIDGKLTKRDGRLQDGSIWIEQVIEADKVCVIGAGLGRLAMS